MAIVARRVDQPVVDRRREVIEVGIAVEVVRDVRHALQVDDVDIGKAARRFEHVALERQRDVELPALDEVGPHDDRIRRPHEVELGLRVRRDERQQVALEAFAHAGQIARRLLELGIEIARVEASHDLASREPLLVGPPPRRVGVGPEALGTVVGDDAPRLDENVPRKQVRKVVPAVAVVEVARQRPRLRVARIRRAREGIEVEDEDRRASTGGPRAPWRRSAAARMRSAPASRRSGPRRRRRGRSRCCACSRRSTSRRATCRRPRSSRVPARCTGAATCRSAADTGWRCRYC